MEPWYLLIRLKAQRLRMSFTLLRYFFLSLPHYFLPSFYPSPPTSLSTTSAFIKIFIPLPLFTSSSLCIVLSSFLSFSLYLPLLLSLPPLFMPLPLSLPFFLCPISFLHLFLTPLINSVFMLCSCTSYFLFYLHLCLSFALSFSFSSSPTPSLSPFHYIYVPVISVFVYNLFLHFLFSLFLYCFYYFLLPFSPSSRLPHQ